ncbi:conserved Plasmodium protein, unknown function [Plasmodium knowlesi strain H]|uniref:Uncharacterized protein n=3 Tax=Plasmodium knowlesi TaxID=5850 RepID=A0A5K1UF93_PLAKH|nr:conserved Plasmodium protein, unknown function [Plasmodium knowlesi strain H]OTN65264.1 Uncharacterized protein PKNOH_S110108900 [Plasmodium knowlesi]CAA9989706.1 conserved Plasmodium protein, unknown function [Plasmodium knowlesi strain H]SBO22860.1 conserved Plasmodium protein, unknown function [Plasmodium knowlesi strain H]SBO23041.1 conserved Plasmodium protein, unknown function [Plasmodium knowlesi strain H]VVS79180.1 conserved Plasmodium protein, unknown function [Plasmodium knowlesi |eukprot:XP_002260429.1 hypothetical protein, conserved in Plasmodium species [Plasmodium knowlesi strain H]
MSPELFNEVDFIKKYYNFRNPEGGTTLDENEENKLIQLLTICKNKIEQAGGGVEGCETQLNNYIKALKILIFYIPHNDSIKRKITERKTYQNLFLGRQNNADHANSLIKNGNSDMEKERTSENFSPYVDVDKYELIFLINLVTHNEDNSEIFAFLYPFYFYYIIINRLNKDYIFMLLNNFIINDRTYEQLCTMEDFSFVLFLCLWDLLKKIKKKATICNYFYIFIENALKNENKLFLHILQNMKLLYVDFYTHIEKMNENVFFFFKKNIVPTKWKIVCRGEKKNYLFKYIALMFKLIYEAVYNILDEKNLESEQICKYQNVYKNTVEHIKESLTYINDVTYFDNFQEEHMELYHKNVLFMDMFIYHKKKFSLENFKLILFISNIFSDRYEELDYLSCSEKKNFVDIIFTYLKTILRVRSDHLSKKEEMLYHKFVLNRYILSFVANFSVDQAVSNYIKQINGLDILRKFMYIDDKDTCLAEYSILAIKHIKENENLDDF